MIQETLIRAICAAFAAIGFGAVSNPTLRSFSGIALLATVGYAIRFLLIEFLGMDIATSTLLASMVIGFGSLGLGGILHCPMTTLYIPALLPMVPGMYAYKAVFSIILFMQNFQTGAEAETVIYLNKFFSNVTVTVTVMASMTVGASLPMFIFVRKAKSLTRGRMAKAKQQRDGFGKWYKHIND